MHDFRGLRAKRETPRGMYRVAMAIAVLSTLNFAIGLSRPEIYALHLALGAIIAGGATLIRRPSFPPRLVAVVVGTCTAIFTAELQLEVWLDPTPLGYIYVAMATLGSASLLIDPKVLAAYSALNLAGATAIALADPWVLAPAKPVDWLIVTVTTLLVGTIFMFQRLRSLDELGDAMEAQSLLATRDPLTTLLNRRGMEERLPEIARLARAGDRQLYACFVDIDWLKTANDAHGHDFGDRIITVVGSALVSALPDGTAVARWGGDEFLAVGVGTHPEAESLHARLLAHIRDSGLDLTKWPGTVSLGSASAHTDDMSIDDLIRLADEAMYLQRRNHRTQ